MKKYFKIQIETSSSDQSERWIAQLSESNFYAFEEDDNLLKAYITEENFNDEKLKEILPVGTIFTKIIIEEENWNQQWESEIKAVIIKDFVAIRPSFASAIPDVKYDLTITPKMSFGTGHHATTHLMVEIMEEIDFNQKSVIDFGTGTGVLAVLAEKCGAYKITAVDFDEWSIINATENIEANKCQKITLKQQSDLSRIDPADIVLANINLNVLREKSFSIDAVSKLGSCFLASGFLIKDESEILKIFEEYNFVKKRKEQLDGWMAVLFEKH